MNLPNADQAVVERAKIVDYLLNPAHPDNGGKTRFFTKLGFRRGEWEGLASALRALASEAEVVHHSNSPHGEKYVMIGRIVSPGGKSPRVKTIWIVDRGWEVARLVTAYPYE